ncbi:MAG: SRPBCC family protein [Archangium sp.]|nr:SRPBCC family protein [Archangium sp.]
MKTVSVSKRINVAAEAAWHWVRRGDAMHRWAPFISACTLDGKGVGAKRVCIVQGHELYEVLETIDDEQRLFQYRIVKQAMLPLKDVLGTIRLTALSASECEVLWFLNCEATDEAAWPEVKKGIEAMYLMGIKGLEEASRS